MPGSVPPAARLTSRASGTWRSPGCSAPPAEAVGSSTSRGWADKGHGSGMGVALSAPLGLHCLCRSTAPLNSQPSLLPPAPCRPPLDPGCLHPSSISLQVLPSSHLLGRELQPLCIQTHSPGPFTSAQVDELGRPDRKGSESRVAVGSPVYSHGIRAACAASPLPDCRP